MGAFPSGQRGQTVNLLSTTSVVRIHPLPPRRSKVRFAPTSFYTYGPKDVIRPLPCSSFPNRTRCRWAPVWDAALRAAFYIRGNIDFNCPSQQNGDPARGCRFVLLWIWKPTIDKAAAGPCSRRGLPAEKRTHPRRCAPFRLSPGAAARQLVCRPANGWFIAGGCCLRSSRAASAAGGVVSARQAQWSSAAHPLAGHMLSLLVVCNATRFLLQ